MSVALRGGDHVPVKGEAKFSGSSSELVSPMSLKIPVPVCNYHFLETSTQTPSIYPFLSFPMWLLFIVY